MCGDLLVQLPDFCAQAIALRRTVAPSQLLPSALPRSLEPGAIGRS